MLVLLVPVHDVSMPVPWHVPEYVPVLISVLMSVLVTLPKAVTLLLHLFLFLRTVQIITSPSYSTLNRMPFSHVIS